MKYTALDGHLVSLRTVSEKAIEDTMFRLLSDAVETWPDANAYPSDAEIVAALVRAVENCINDRSRKAMLRYLRMERVDKP